MTLHGVLLDVDGTLILSNDAHAQSWIEAFAAHGYTVSFDQIRPLMGMGGDQIMPRFFPELNHETGTGKAISDDRKQLVLEKFVPQIQPANGSRELVQKIQDAGLKVVIASSASEQELESLLEVAQVKDLIQIATTSSEAAASKPEPNIVEAALQKIDLPPQATVMLGDTPYDVEAANKAGVDVIAFRCGGFSDEDLHGAIAIYDDPADLIQRYDESPLSQFTVIAS
ncbi:MAG: HAD family hydrolase [Leptolyngbyaceae cyanobacterium bins.349]|nr:HAD family hydrolase [Leptolyngbyaceae cyanobacterium bins.349]